LERLEEEEEQKAAINVEEIKIADPTPQG